MAKHLTRLAVPSSFVVFVAKSGPTDLCRVASAASKLRSSLRRSGWASMEVLVRQLGAGLYEARPIHQEGKTGTEHGCSVPNQQISWWSRPA